MSLALLWRQKQPGDGKSSNPRVPSNNLQKHCMSMSQNTTRSAFPFPVISEGFHPAQQISAGSYKFCLAVSLSLGLSPSDKPDKPPPYLDPKEQSPLQTV